MPRKASWGRRAWAGVTLLAVGPGCMAFQDVEYSTESTEAQPEEACAPGTDNYCDTRGVRQVCVDGRWNADPQCAEGVCHPTQGCAECYGDVYECRGSVQFGCSEEGAFVAREDCGAKNMLCDTVLDHCVECSSSSNRCETGDSSLTVLNCDSEGRFTESSECNSTVRRCVAVDGFNDYCSECYPEGAQDCVGGAPSTCGSNFKWVKQEACAATLICRVMGEVAMCVEPSAQTL